MRCIFVKSWKQWTTMKILLPNLKRMVLEEALAYELAGKFYQSLGKELIHQTDN